MKRPNDEQINFAIGVICSLGIVIAVACMIYLAVGSPPT